MSTICHFRRLWLLLLSLFVLPGFADASQRVKPWMLADWENQAPHLSDLGLSPRDMAFALDNRLFTFSHPEKDIVLPGAKGPRRFQRARFVTTVARVDLPVQTLRRNMRDFSTYKNHFPMLTESDVVAIEGANQVVRFRIEVPMPALASFIIDFRFKQRLERDGSISGLLIDGEAKSLIAMLGGMTDELAGQPVLTRWEFLPVSANQSLLVFTYWDRVDLKSYFARKFLEQYPELRVAGPYMVSAGAVESIRQNFSLSTAHPAKPGVPDWASLARLQPFIHQLSANGHVGILEPELPVPVTQKQKPLRYASLATRISATPEASRRITTSYGKLPDVMKEIRTVEVQDRGKEIDLALGIRFAFMVIRFSLDMDVRNTWVSPERLEFQRTAGQLARLSGGAEWHPVPGKPQTLMLTAAAHEIGDEAPLVLRLAHRIVEQIPFAEALASMAVQIVMMERMKPWVEGQVSGASIAAK